MNTQKLISVNSVASAILAIVLLSNTACSSYQDNPVDAKSQSTASSGNVKPPSIDIHTATVMGNLDAITQHISAGSNLNEKDPYGGSSPLISAAVFGKTEIAKALIEAGADLSIKNNEGSTALLTAAFFCRVEIVQMLLDKGADKSVKNNFGSTALESVTVPFKDVKAFYDILGKQLGSYGLKLNYEELQKTRPVIAEMLRKN